LSRLNEMYSPNSHNMSTIERCFQDLLDGGEIPINLKGIREAVKKEFNIDASVRIVVTKKGFFGMSVSPSRQELERIALEIVETNGGKNGGQVQFKQCTEVVIQMDSRIFTLRYKNTGNKIFTARELTAMLLHEIGHKIHSNDIINDLKEMYIKNFGGFFGAGIITGASVIPAATVGLGIATGTLPILTALLTIGCAIGFTQINSSDNHNKTENDADSFPALYGYGNEMHSVLTKLRDMLSPDLNPRNGKDPIDVWFRWVKEQFSHIGIRRKNVVKVLKDELQHCQTDLEKEILIDQIKKIERRF
jgi:hypothetical protein